MNEAPGNSGRATILVVDDSPVNLSLMNKLLADDYKVKVATSGEKALKTEPDEMPQTLLDTVSALLSDLLAEIDRVMPCAPAEAAPNEAATLDVAALTPLLHELAQLLADDDGEATTRIGALAALMQGTALAEDYRRLDKMIESFAFGEALDLLRGIAARLDMDRL